MPLTAATSPNNLELRKLSVHATPNAVDQFMNSRNFNHASSANQDDALSSPIQGNSSRQNLPIQEDTPTSTIQEQIDINRPSVQDNANKSPIQVSVSSTQNYESKPSTSAQEEKSVTPTEELQIHSYPPSPYYNLSEELDGSGPRKVPRMAPTVAEISRFDRHTMLFSAMVAPSRSRCSSPVRRLLSSRDPCTSCFQPSTTTTENGLVHNIESMG